MIQLSFKQWLQMRPKNKRTPFVEFALAAIADGSFPSSPRDGTIYKWIDALDPAMRLAGLKTVRTYRKSEGTRLQFQHEKDDAAYRKRVARHEATQLARLARLAKEARS